MAMERNWNVFQGVRRLESLVVLTKVKYQALVNSKYEHAGVANYFERFKCQGSK